MLLFLLGLYLGVELLGHGEVVCLALVDTRFFFLINFFIYLFFGCVGSSFLCEGFLQLRRAGGHSSSRCAGLSLSRPLLLRSTGSRHAGSVIVAHGPSCSAACGIFPEQGSNPCPLHRQADSQPLRHQGSPRYSFLFLRARTQKWFMPLLLASHFQNLVTCPQPNFKGGWEM